MPQKVFWTVMISVNNNPLTQVEIVAETAEEAEDQASELIMLSAKKAYKKGQENEQKTEEIKQ